MRGGALKICRKLCCVMCISIRDVRTLLSKSKFRVQSFGLVLLFLFCFPLGLVLSGLHSRVDRGIRAALA